MSARDRSITETRRVDFPSPNDAERCQSELAHAQRRQRRCRQNCRWQATYFKPCLTSHQQNVDEPRIFQDDPRQKSEKYWFGDGNIVLKAGETLYRVHSSIFARHSEVFKDMFSIPQPSEEADAEMIDGCPIIPLMDAEQDLENVISIFYDNKIGEFRGRLPFFMVESMLRLGNKYGITHLEEEALFRLHHDYPQDLMTWDALLNEVVQPFIESNDVEDATWVIDTAHEFHLNTILPAAYSTLIKRIQSMEEITSAEYLPKKAQERCLIGYAKMIEYLKDKNLDALCPPFLPAKSCVGHCESKKCSVIKGLRIWETKSLGILDPGEPVVTADLCSRCKVEVKKFTKKTRQDLWARLPTFYGLPFWENLHDGLELDL